MNPSSNLEAAELAQAHVPAVPATTHDPLHKDINLADEKHDHHPISASASDTDREPDEPTDEEIATLHRVSGTIPWQAYTIAFVELCERFSYYGTTVVFTNFIQRPLPAGSTTGSDPAPDGRPGALGMGQRASTGLTTFNQFWSYLTPLLGAYIADEFLGRFKTVQWAIAVALVGHVILIVSALPPVIAHGDRAIGAFAVGILIMGVGTGMFKPNISPMLAEQYKEKKMRIITTKKGERKIMDPALTISRIFLYFYVMINLGSIVGQVTMVYAEKHVGFWLSFLLPTVMFTLCPMVLVLCKGRYQQAPPAGSVVSNAFKVWKLAMRGRWSANPATLAKNVKDPEFWEKVKPSRLGPNKPQWMTFDDAWVDQVARGLSACKVFLWMPLYWITYNQMNNNLVSQAATMDLAGIPNDLLNNLNPLSIIILIPILDFFIYPALRKAGIKFTPIKRIATGFMFGAMAMVVATLIQYYIYKKNPCGSHANECLDRDGLFSPINVWAQTPAYVLIGISEIFANVTSLEYAFTKAPTNMRSLVTAVNLLMSAFGNAITYALIGLAEDPLLIWNYGAVAVVAFIGGILFWISHNHLDAREDELNRLKESSYVGRHPENRTADEEQTRVADEGLATNHGTTAAPAA